MRVKRYLRKKDEKKKVKILIYLLSQGFLSEKDLRGCSFTDLQKHAYVLHVSPLEVYYCMQAIVNKKMKEYLNDLAFSYSFAYREGEDVCT